MTDPILKTTKAEMPMGLAQVVECHPNESKTLSQASVPPAPIFYPVIWRCRSLIFPLYLLLYCLTYDNHRPVAIHFG
jgi:hypothetical protein